MIIFIQESKTLRVAITGRMIFSSILLSFNSATKFFHKGVLLALGTKDCNELPISELGTTPCGLFVVGEICVRVSLSRETI